MMKTSERILVTAARLFNDRGERNVSASDIAVELDISPGNLYYHFKGKDGILSALFQRHYQALAGILVTPVVEDGFWDEGNALERSWLFLTVIMESMYSTRFLYLNHSDLMFRYPDIDRGMRRLASLKRQITRQMASAVLASVDIAAHPQRLTQVADSMALNLMSVSYTHLTLPTICSV